MAVKFEIKPIKSINNFQLIRKPKIHKNGENGQKNMILYA